jgi:signal transduction histidine kinase
MARPASAQPRQLLQFLEWTLLGIVTFVEFLDGPSLGPPRFPLLNLACLVIFTAMGFKLPQQAALLIKGFYTLIELGLIVVATEMGGIRLVSLLFVVFVMRNALLFSQRQRHLVALAAFTLFAVFQQRRLWFISSLLAPAVVARIQPVLWSVILLVGLIVLFLQLLMDAWLSDYDSRQQLEAANIRLRQYAIRIEDLATLQERNRIAREIHDALGHSLTALNLNLQAATKLWHRDATEAHTLVTEAQELSIAALNAVRQSVQTLRADPLQGQSLGQALTPLLASFQKTTGILPTVQIEIPKTLTKELSLTVYRIVQETLTNIAKHAAATQVELTCTLSQTAEPVLVLTVQDNGRGFTPTQNTTGFGLQGIQERVTAFGGQLMVMSTPGYGCQIEVHVPLTPVEEI